jgi:hypothetical protein
LSNAQKKAAERGVAAAMERLGINAADLPVYKAAPVVEEAFCGWCLLALAAAIGGGVCLAVCDCARSCGGGPPSVTQHGGASD